MMINSPCYGCTVRCAGCHARCKEYSDYRVKMDERDREICKNKAPNSYPFIHKANKRVY